MVGVLMPMIKVLRSFLPSFSLCLLSTTSGENYRVQLQHGSTVLSSLQLDQRL
jgi:hypothetical protein